MSIQKFYQQAYSNDFARTFQFKVSRLGNVIFDESQFLYLETATLPGRAINNVAVPYMGLQFNVPGTASYPGSDAWSVVFRCDSKYKLRDALELATFQTFDDSNSKGSYNTPDAGQTVVMELLGKNARPVRKYTLFGAWVKSIEASNFDIKDNGSIQTIQCALAYQFWRASKSEAVFDPVARPRDNFYAKPQSDNGATVTAGRFSQQPARQ